MEPQLPYVPPKIWCIGLNYRSHAEDIQAVQPEEPGSFMKPASAVFPPGGRIVLPPPAHVSEVVFGYATTLDLTAPDVLRRNPRYLSRAKSIDTFFSFGPVVVTRDEVADPEGLEVVTEHNGEVCSRDLVSTGCPKGARIRPGDRVAARIEAAPSSGQPVDGGLQPARDFSRASGAGLKPRAG